MAGVILHHHILVSCPSVAGQTPISGYKLQCRAGCGGGGEEALIVMDTLSNEVIMSMQMFGALYGNDRSRFARLVARPWPVYLASPTRPVVVVVHSPSPQVRASASALSRIPCSQ